MNDDHAEFKFEGIYRPARRKDVFNIFLTAVAKRAVKDPTVSPLLCKNPRRLYEEIPSSLIEQPAAIDEAIQRSVNEMKTALTDLVPVECEWRTPNYENRVKIDPYGMLGDFRVNASGDPEQFRIFPGRVSHHGVSWLDEQEYIGETWETVRSNHRIYVGGEAYDVNLEAVDAVISATTSEVLKKTGII